MNFRIVLMQLLVLLLSSCATNPQVPALTPLVEVQAKEAGKDLCNSVSALASTILLARHLGGEGRKEVLVRTMNEGFPGFESTITAMADDAYQQGLPSKPSVVKAAEAAVLFKNRWTEELGVCTDFKG